MARGADLPERIHRPPGRESRREFLARTTEFFPAGRKPGGNLGGNPALRFPAFGR